MHAADCVPPGDDRIPGLMDDLAAFMARIDIPVLAQTALDHAQFENVHPFVDGIGRTGRALVHAMLGQKGLVEHLTVPISAGLLRSIRQRWAGGESRSPGQLRRFATQQPGVAVPGDPRRSGRFHRAGLSTDLRRLKSTRGGAPPERGPPGQAGVGSVPLYVLGGRDT
jgi:hypothetical protein